MSITHKKFTKLFFKAVPIFLVFAVATAGGVLLAGQKTDKQASEQNPQGAEIETPTAASPACVGNDRPIEFKRLANEEEYPFLFHGRPVSEDKSDYDEYRASISRFPDVRSCLKDSEKEKELPNLTLFDWDEIESTHDAEVCLFRIFSSIGSVEGAEQWFESQGFRLGLTRTVPVSVMRKHGEQTPIDLSPEIAESIKQTGASHPTENPNAKPGTGIGATWSINKCGERFRNREKEHWIISPHALSVSATFTADNEVDTVGVIYNTL